MTSLRDRLLALPVPNEKTVPPTAYYTGQGFTAADATDLIENWIDHELAEQEDDVVDAVLIHAWSLIARLGGEAGREFLRDELAVSMSLGDDLFPEHFDHLMLACGPDAVPELIAELEEARDEEPILIALAAALAEFARRDVERETALAALVAVLQGDYRHRSLKALAIADLIELARDRFLPEIRAAFERNLVDVMVSGDLEEVEVGLGSRAERSGSRPNWPRLESELAEASIKEQLGPRPVEGDDSGIIRYFLKLHGGPRSVKDLAEFDGLMLGTVLAPAMVPPSRWLPAIWDPEDHAGDPEWDGEEDAELFLTAVMNWYNGIIHRLDDGTYAPPFEPRTRPRVPTEEEKSWSRGLITSVLVWEGGAAEASEYHQAFMAAALHLADPTDDAADGELIQVDHIVRAAGMLRESQQQGVSLGDGGTYFRDNSKVGRNDPCPCGSGRKYKRCCMN